MNLETPDYASPLQVGDKAVVYGTACTNNNSGGTCILEHDGSGIAVTVTKAFWDYETGWRFHGRAEGSVVDEFRRQATTGYTAEHYREKYPNAPELAQTAEKAMRDFDPAKLYFSEHDLTPRPTARPR